MTNKKQIKKSIDRAVEQIAIITYNCIGNPQQYENGWTNYPGKKVLLMQNGHRSERAVAGSENSAMAERIRKSTLSYLLEGIKPILPQLNHVYLYVGAHGAEGAIEMTKDIPAEKITYVMCKCNSYEKKALIREIGNKNAEIMSCECGGNYTLEKILKDIKKESKK
ncbi:MAG: hypothetical protein KKE23_02285 [Nanoarchaeota archaeon]|nr:hypothetical protein [Nanoarchaeota archaeon]